jgi:cation transport ATPase
MVLEAHDLFSCCSEPFISVIIMSHLRTAAAVWLFQDGDTAITVRLVLVTTACAICLATGSAYIDGIALPYAV